MLPLVPSFRSPWPNLRLSRFINVVILLVLITATYPAFAPDAQAIGNTYYVAINGDDSAPGTTIGQPWRTLEKAAGTLQAGDTVLIRGGVYVSERRDPQIEPVSSGTPDRYITYKAYPGESVTLQGRYPSGNDNNWFGFLIKGKSYLQIEGLRIRGFHAGIACQTPSHHIIIKDNDFEYNSEAGVELYGPAGASEQGCDYVTIVGNLVHDNGYYDNGQPATGPYEGWASGITIKTEFKFEPYWYDSSTSRFHTTISRNTIYHNYDGTGGDSDNEADHTEGHGILIEGGVYPPFLIENNVIFDNGGQCICAYGAQSIWIMSNSCYKNSADPLFLNSRAKSELAAYQGPPSYPIPTKNIHVLNNIAWARAGQKITNFPDSTPLELDLRNNLWNGCPPDVQDGSFDPSPYGQNPVFGDPLFGNASINPQEADFHLQSRSPAIDAGANIDAGAIPLRTDPVVVDRDGANRPRLRGYDMGAYESSAGPMPPQPTVANFSIWLPYLIGSEHRWSCQ
jgi:hypothetical protein